MSYSEYTELNDVYNKLCDIYDLLVDFVEKDKTKCNHCKMVEIGNPMATQTKCTCNE